MLVHIGVGDIEGLPVPQDVRTLVVVQCHLVRLGANNPVSRGVSTRSCKESEGMCINTGDSSGSHCHIDITTLTYRHITYSQHHTAVTSSYAHNQNHSHIVTQPIVRTSMTDSHKVYIQTVTLSHNP